MKIVIQGTKYDVAEIGRLSLLDLMELKKQSGMSVEDMTGPLESAEGNSLIDTYEGNMALAALIWLTRRKAGERDLTFEQACDFPLDELDVVPDELEEEPADPQ